MKTDQTAYTVILVIFHDYLFFNSLTVEISDEWKPFLKQSNPNWQFILMIIPF